ncbi:MAG TPA: efflux RND transporter permease subunit, partial [Burkholderiaceae bacterium]|nr:efflux RND transporter permease subunit [Burkholderiaceae bacterium]
QGIDYLASSSVGGVSTITANLRLNVDANRVLTEISTRVNAVKNQLPPQAQQPVITVQAGQTTDAMYLGFYADQLQPNAVTDYLSRVVKPRLDALPGVQTAEILGGRSFALRAWLDTTRLAAHGLTAADVSAALSANNVLAPAGRTRGESVAIDLRADTDLSRVEDFQRLVIRTSNVGTVRLEDVASVVLGSEDYNSSVAFGGRNSVFIGIKVAPDANLLDVAKSVREALPEIAAALPAGMQTRIAYDATDYVRTSIREVAYTLVEALAIVTAVIFLFLGSWRAIAVPVVAIPLSLVGTFLVMQVLGYSINLLTLLALVLAIGLVVDDAIIVTENIDRHMREEGRTPLQAALIAARELGGPIIAMTIVLVAAYVPIGLQGGLTGALFTEFAFTLAGAVSVSALVALTLSPMLCARLFQPAQESGRLAIRIDAGVERLRLGYRRALASTLRTPGVLMAVGVVLLAFTGYLFATAAVELAPEEDQGVVLGQMTGAPSATAAQMQTNARLMFEVAHSLPEYSQMFQLTGLPNVNQGIAGVMLKPWDERQRSAKEIQQELQTKWNGIAGVRVAAFQFPALPGASGLPIQFVVSSTEPVGELSRVASQVVDKARDSGRFFFIDTDLKIDRPQSRLVIDRDKVSSLGITQKDLADALGAALSGGYVNYFAVEGRSYKVIPQVQQTDRLNPDQILDQYVQLPAGGVVKLANVARLESSVEPESINHFQQLNSATISGVALPTTSQGDALALLRGALHAVAPVGYSVDYAGPSRQFIQESSSFAWTMALAMIVVFLVLAAQFESFRDPAVILVSVPMALFGALLFINLGVATLNIYTQVGLVTLMGLISKHGILIVQFANELQSRGLSKREAIEEAAAVRLRPILMTTAAMVLGVLPLVVATGAGAAGRHAMGLVIMTGLSIGTLFTLFMVPAVYLLLGATHHHPAPADGLSAEA